MRNNDLVVRLLRLWLQRRQGPASRRSGKFGGPVRGLRPRRRRGSWRALLRLVLLAVALALIVRACHARDPAARPASADSRAAATATHGATWL